MEKENKTLEKFNFQQVVTKNIVTDAFQGIRNIFGLRLRGYEKMIDAGIKEVMLKMSNSFDVVWYRLIVNPLMKGSAMIIVYGEGFKK
jgi:uncharacterized protein YbjQ (UPF0145 family)